jgi:hypothetical protein
MENSQPSSSENCEKLLFVPPRRLVLSYLGIQRMCNNINSFSFSSSCEPVADPNNNISNFGALAMELMEQKKVSFNNEKRFFMFDKAPNEKKFTV